MPVSIINSCARMRRLRRCSSQARLRSVPPSRRDVVADMRLLLRHVERLVAEDHATWRQPRGGSLEVTLATGEIFRLGKTTVIRIF
jgi:hypothetical protein